MLTFRPPSQLKRCCWAWVNQSYSMSQVWSCNTSTWGTNHQWFSWWYPANSIQDVQTKKKAYLFSSNDEEEGEEATRQSAVVAVWSARFHSECCYHSICCDASMKPQLNAIQHVTANCVGLARQDSKWQADTSSTHEHTYSCSPSGLQENLRVVAAHESTNHVPHPKSDHATPQPEEQIIHGSYGATLMTAHVICKQKQASLQLKWWGGNYEAISSCGCRSARFPSECCYHSICCDASMKPQLNAIHHVTTNCIGLAR